MRHRNPASGVPSRITERPSPVSDRRGSLERHRATQIVERRLLTSPRALLHHVQEGGSEAWPERSRGDPGARCDGSQRSSARASASLERVQLPFAALSTTRGGCRARAWTVQSFHLLKKPDASAEESLLKRRERLVVCGCPGGATGDGALGGAGSSRAGARRTHRAREPPRASHPPPASLRSACTRGRAAEHAPPRRDAAARGGRLRARPTAVARLTASLGASTSTRRDVHVDRRADTRAARRERRDAKHARELGPTSARPICPRRWTQRCRARWPPWREASTRSRDARGISRSPTSATSRSRSASRPPPPTSPRKSSATRRSRRRPTSTGSSRRRHPRTFSTRAQGPSTGPSTTRHEPRRRRGGYRGATRTRTAVRRIRPRPVVQTVQTPHTRRVVRDPSPHSPRRIGAEIGRNPGEAKDGRCTSPRRVRVEQARDAGDGREGCVGCEQMLPTTELIRVARMADADDDGGAPRSTKNRREGVGRRRVDRR